LYACFFIQSHYSGKSKLTVVISLNNYVMQFLWSVPNYSSCLQRSRKSDQLLVIPQHRCIWTITFMDVHNIYLIELNCCFICWRKTFDLAILFTRQYLLKFARITNFLPKILCRKIRTRFYRFIPILHCLQYFLLD
jgi:hypothetical protein